MTDLTVLNDQCTVFVNWTTSSEKNTSHYNVMRTSINTNITTPIAQISAKGNTQDKTSYSYTDREVTTGSYTYHLEIVDIDGHQSESDKKSVQVNCQTNTDKVSVYPNPTTGQLNIRINSEQNDIFVINVRDAVGRLVMQTTVEVHNVTKNTLLNLSELSSGTYSVEVKGSYDSQTFKIALSK